MELGSIIGLIAGGLVLIIGMLLVVDLNVGLAITAFVNIEAVVIVLGGTFAATIIAFPLYAVLNSFKAVTKIFKQPQTNPRMTIAQIIELAQLARREGILALEERAQEMDDQFLKKGIMLIVDGTDPELVRSILETEMAYVEARHSNSRSIWGYIGSSAPAWGMLGTLIGLIAMLLNLEDPDALGPGMAVALITTLYGSIVANYVALPIESKLKYFNSEEILLKEILVEGMLSVQAGENPRIIEEKLKSFLPPTLRTPMQDTGGAA